MSLRDPTTKQTGHFRPTPRGGVLFGPPPRRGSSEYHLCQVRHRRRFLTGAKNHAVATRRLLGQAPGQFCFAEAIENSRRLFAAARAAGVRRIVHVSITHPDEKSDLEYFRGKAQVEKALAQCGVNYTILRPAVIFGQEDILINNIAWVLRHLPVFGVFGDGQYKMQPIYVDDLAELAVQCAADEGNRIVEAIGPETFTYRELVEVTGKTIGCVRPIVSVNPVLGYSLAWLMGKFVRDVIITRDEIRGLMEGRLYVEAPPAGTTKLTQWAASNSAWLGRRYASELARRNDRRHDYVELRGDGAKDDNR